MDKAQYWINLLNLIPHPEGGFFREIYSSNIYVEGNSINDKFTGRRNLSTSIYFLLQSGDVSRFHRLRSDEVWFYHKGSSLTIYTIDSNGNRSDIRLGKEIENGEVFQAIIPAGTMFGASVNVPNSFTIFGCMVSPGFNSEDFEQPDRRWLLKKYPQYKDIILKMTNP